MNTMTPILECVPNFSEGRDMAKIEAIADAIRSVSGVHLLHIDISPAANRTVMTFAGESNAVVKAAFKAIKTAAQLIDMREQEGVHPRIGATDVCPLVPLSGISMEEAIGYSQQLGERVGDELDIPVYLYEYSATAPHRQALPDIRNGQYERMAAKMQKPEWKPDYGPQTFNAKTGATVIGARDVLVAYNVSLDTTDVTKAVYIAERLRERGYVRAEGTQKIKVPGVLKKLRAIGWYMADYGNAQVSMNVLDYRVTSPLEVWEQCEALAHSIGVKLIGSEVIGLIPEQCLLEAGSLVFLKNDQPVPEEKSLLVHQAIELFGLNKLKPFDPEEKVLEYALVKAGLLEA